MSSRAPLGNFTLIQPQIIPDHLLCPKLQGLETKQDSMGDPHVTRVGREHKKDSRHLWSLTVSSVRETELVWVKELWLTQGQSASVSKFIVQVPYPRR